MLFTSRIMIRSHCQGEGERSRGRPTAGTDACGRGRDGIRKHGSAPSDKKDVLPGRGKSSPRIPVLAAGPTAKRGLKIWRLHASHGNDACKEFSPLLALLR